MKRAILYLIVGAAAGLAAFGVSEPFAPQTLSEIAWRKHGAIFSVALGIFVAAGLGAASGRMQGSKIHVLRGLGVGFLAGLVCGPIGNNLGNAIYAALGGQGGSVISRVAGWGTLGIFIGLAAAITEGLVAQSMKRTYQAAIGGLLGGAIGGFAFEVAAIVFGSAIAMANGTTGDVGGPSRAISLTILGASIGLLIGIAQALSRSAKIRLVLGRNEGKEWPVDAQNTVIGRSETAHIPLLGDPNIASHHASIIKQGGQYILVDAGSPMGTGLNGFQIQNAPLSSGDVINIGTLQLVFSINGQAVRNMPMQQMQMPVQPLQPVQPMQPTQAFQPTQMPTQMSNPTMAAPAVYTLTATTGPLSGQRFPIAGGLELGRASIQVSLAFDNLVSRNHATITNGPNGPIIKDEGSKNGTLVNGNPITQKDLVKGDTIQIGSTVFRVE